MIRSKFFAILLLVLLLSGTLSNCTGSFSPSQNKTITIAVVEENFGTVSRPNPQSIYAGVKLAADQMNSQGIDVRVVPYADGNDEQTAQTTALEIAASDALAVIGHSTIETSRAGAQVYDSRMLPAVAVVPVNDDLLETHPSFFSITYTTEMQAAYLANYLRKIQGQETASIIYSSSTYDRKLAETFANTFTGLGGHITFREKISDPAGNDELDALVSKFVTADTSKNNPGAILIATDTKTTSELIVKMNQRGLSYPIVGGDNINSPQFVEIMSTNSEEKNQAGALTDGILTTSSVIFDSASRFAHQFLKDYHEVYPQPDSSTSVSNNNYYRSDPGNKVANGYDAALAIVTAALQTDLSDNDIQSNREKLYQEMKKMDSAARGAQGIVGPLYFDPSRNVVGTARFGVYQNGQLISAMTQFEPIRLPEQFKRQELQEQVKQGLITTVHGKYVYVANVVYAGVDMIGIHDVDVKTSTYAMDFYLWFRYRANTQDFKPGSFVFTNQVSVDESSFTPIREPATTNGITTETYRVTGTFKNPFYFYEYPFDRQALSIQFRNQDATTTYVQYVVDRIGMQYRNEETLRKHFEENGAFSDLNGWQVMQTSAQESIYSTTSTLGSPQNFGRNTSTDFSLININIEVQRNSLQFIIKSLLPLLFTLILAYITFFLPLGHSERLGVGSTALLTTAFFHISLADSLPQIGYTVAMEYLFYAAYLMSAAIVFLETISIRIEKRSEEEKDEDGKKPYQKKRENLNLIGRIIYPSILACVLLGGILVSLGQLNLGPNLSDDSSNLVSRLPDPTTQGEATATATREVVQVNNGPVTLRLQTWRPEDTDNMKRLLEEFHQYALDHYQKDIRIEYEAVIGSGYDSLLSSQLAKGQAPDLFYVRPHAVDGDLASYLLDITDLDIESKFDENESQAWRNDADRRFYAMPYVGVVQGVYYNRDYFDQYGLKEPTTWQEFIELAKFIQSKGKTPIANALNDYQDSEMFQSILVSFVGGAEGRTRYEGTDGANACFNKFPLLGAFEAVEEIRPFLLPDAATMDDTKGKASFIQQDSIMLFGGSWDVEMFARDAKFNWSVFAVPAPAGRDAYIIFEPDTGVGINKDGLHQEEAKLFLKWLMTEGVAASDMYLPGRYPLIRPDQTNTAYTNPDDPFSKLKATYPSDIRWMSAEVDTQYPRASEIVRQALYEMVQPQTVTTELGAVKTEYLTAQDAVKRLQTGLGEWYLPAQVCK